MLLFIYVQFDPRESMAFPDMSKLSNEQAMVPPSIASVFPNQPQAGEQQTDGPRIVSSAQKGSLWNATQTAGKQNTFCYYLEDVFVLYFM